MTKEKILEALSTVQEPDLGKGSCDPEYGEGYRY